MIENVMKKIVFLLMVMLLGVGGYAQEGEYVDLGLPSGTKWKTVNEKGYFRYDSAVALFEKELPCKEQWEELKSKCEWTWVEGESAETTGMRVTGPNGKSIFLPAAGRRDGTDVGYVGTDGYYWSSSYYYLRDAWCMKFDSDSVYMLDYYRSRGLSVRLVRD